MNTKKLTPEDFLFMQDEVVRFNKMMGNSLDCTGAAKEALINTYRKLSLEEVVGEGELLDSVAKGDKVGVLDGYVDCVFTIFYYALLEGEGLREGDLWLLEECESVHGEICLQWLEEDLHVDNPAIDSHTHLIASILAEQDNYDFVGAFNEVMKSNMSKYAIKSDIHIPTELGLILSKGRYEELSYDEIESEGGEGGAYIAFKASKDAQNGVEFKTPKLIKCSTFVEPELEKFIK